MRPVSYEREVELLVDQLPTLDNTVERSGIYVQSCTILCYLMSNKPHTVFDLPTAIHIQIHQYSNNHKYKYIYIYIYIYIYMFVCAYVHIGMLANVIRNCLALIQRMHLKRKIRKNKSVNFFQIKQQQDRA
jgi:hypothetical protein